MNKKDLDFWQTLIPILNKFKLVHTDTLSKDDNKSIFITAFTHKSYSNEHKDTEHNDYLEFIGDGLLQYIVTEWIKDRKPKWDSGLATKLRSAVVDKKNLSKVAEFYDLFSYLRHSKAAFINGINQKTVSNLYEAFIGAIYSVYGLEETKRVVKQTLFKSFNEHYHSQHSHPKNILQEYFQQSSKSNVVYFIDKLPDNTFKSTVSFEGIRYGEGIGKSKKEAETEAAIDALTKLKVIIE